MWAKAVGPVIEWAARELYGRPGDARLPSPLTNANRFGRHPKKAQPQTVRKRRPALPLRKCKMCGKVLTKRDGEFCSSDCLQDYKAQVIVPRFKGAGLAKLYELRAQGINPSHGGEAGKKRGRANAKRIAEQLAGEAVHGDGAKERAKFKKEILPRLAKVSLSQIMRATGLSGSYASDIRRGRFVPHPMHFQALKDLVDSAD